MILRRAGLALLFAATASPVPARESGPERPYTPSLRCAVLQALVARRGDVVLATSAVAYELVHHDSGACQQDVSAAPAFEPTLDDPNCFAGYRCRQRMNDGTGGGR